MQKRINGLIRKQSKLTLEFPPAAVGSPVQWRVRPRVMDDLLHVLLLEQLIASILDSVMHLT
jgi:hypothetical protein